MIHDRLEITTKSASEKKFQHLLRYLKHTLLKYGPGDFDSERTLYISRTKSNKNLP
tara:strand:- start:457 stop:624 length:168 start_codon:yes stop_codon:yes gene_type:complete